MKKISKIWIAVIVIIIAAVVAFLMSGSKKKEEVKFETTKVEKGNVTSSITATGTIEAVTTVTVGTQVSGIIDKLYVDYNTVVKKGQVIAELDKTNLTSELRTAQANLKSAQSSLTYKKANYQRYKTLYDKGLVSADDYENALLSYRQAQESVNTSQQSVNKAQTNLGYATIYSPIDGVVISKSVEEGQTVAASYSTPELFTIAKDLTDMRVVADVDEADIGNVRQGEKVIFTVDAYPDETFEGQVTQVRLEATTTNNVVTYEVVISAPNQDLKLKPGLTANVTIYTMEKTNIITVPNKALKFTPTKETVGKMKIQDTKATNKVWTLSNGTFKAHAVTLGDTDGIRTEIKSGIKEGEEVVVGITSTTEEETENSSDEQSPFAPGPKKNDKKSGSKK